MDEHEDKTKDTLRIIADNTEFLVCLPWNGVEAWFKICMLNATQMQSCGNFSLLSFPKEDAEQLSEDEILEEVKDIKNTQENIFKLCLSSPTFDDIIEMYKATDVWKRIKKKETEIRAGLNELEKIMNDMSVSAEERATASTARSELEAELNRYEIFQGFIFPDDFSDKLTTIMYQKHNSDILRVSENMLLQAAFLAERGHDNPHDHISGLFTEFHKQDIDKHAWYLLSEYREKQKTDKDTNGNTWYRGA